MRGQVLGVDRSTGEGVVAGEDGRRYRFRQDDWATGGEPSVGLPVDFETADDRALAVFPVPGSTPPVAARSGGGQAPTTGTDRNKLVAALLAFFVGTLGIHRFYLGRNGSGAVMLILSLTVVGLLFSAPWALIDAVRYLVMPDREFAARYARF